MQSEETLSCVLTNYNLKNFIIRNDDEDID